MPLFNLLVRIIDKGPDVAQSKRGDLIAAQLDGWQWSNEELTNDFWRIIRTNIPQTIVDSLLASDPAESLTPPKQRKRRNWTLDVASLPNPQLYTGARTQAIIDVVAGQVIAATKKKP